MGDEGPKLFSNKPKKKVQLKQGGQELASPASAAARSYTMGAPPSQPPPPPPKESFLRRYKFLVPLGLAANGVILAYWFMRTKQKDTSIEEVSKEVPSTPASTAVAGAPVTEKPQSVPSQPVAELEKPRDPIPQDQQRELLKWILEEKRKIKPKDPEEKKKIDEEKALLKQFIRAKSIPNI